MFKYPISQHPLPSQIHRSLLLSFFHPKLSSMKISTMSIQTNKENIPPVNKNSIPLIASSFKKNSSKRKIKRIPLADITNLFQNSSPFTMTPERNGVSSVLPSASILLRSNSRRRTLVVAQATVSKTLRMGFR
ncbi:unnamed protein product [Trifolium pratense]|uniref:Uncharacterized protein n=1 Tax=Trifolium pratense TaxID=57577 RepID=A0ACB0KVR0_TRIPR|nr:unnamed protein product [Trifolium pratense]